MYNNTNSDWLPLKVTVGSSTAITSTGRTFMYYSSYTPKIKYIYPSTIFGSSKIKIWGVQQINRVGDDRFNAG